MSKVFQKMKMVYVVLAVVAVAGLAFAFSQNRNNRAQSAGCSGTVMQIPVLNYWPISYSGASCHDFPLIDAKNISSDSGRDARYSSTASEHSTGINANAGDNVRVSIYVHNGATDDPNLRFVTTAQNVQIGANVDMISPSTTHTISGNISAANADPVNSASKGGDITIHTPSNTTLEYVPGSTQLCVGYDAAVEYGADLSRTCGTGADGKPQVLIPMSDGVINSTVGIGELKACFPYSASLVFTLHVNAAGGSTVTPTPTPTQNPTLQVIKTVKNLTKGETDYKSSTTANPGDRVQFQIQVTNNGSVDMYASQVYLKDQLPAGLTNPDVNTKENSIFGSTGMAMGDLSRNDSRFATIAATVSASAGTTITNTATAKASNTNEASGSATVVVQAPAVTTPTNTTLSVEKMVRNITAGGTFAKSTTAKKNEVVEYQVTVTNTGSVTARNVSTNDVLPYGADFGGVTSGQLAGTSGYAFGDIPAGQSRTITYQATINGLANTIVNTATARADNAPSVSSSATVTYQNVQTQTQTYTYSFDLTKSVRDVDQGQTNWVTATNSYNGNNVEFKIEFKNTGTGTLNNVRINDTLPSGLNFTPNSLSSNVALSSNNSLSNITFSSLAPSQTITLTFRAQVNQASGSLTNTVSASADSAGSKTAQATVNIASRQGNIQVTKLVKNVTKGTALSSRVTALPGEKVGYQIQVSTTNGDANNVTVYETLPQYLTYVSGSVRLNGNQSGIPEDFLNRSVNIGKLSTSGTSTATIYFEATVAGSMPNGQTLITNTVNASADNIGTVSASAVVEVNVQTTTTGGGGYNQLSITKLVRNLSYNSNGQGNWQKTVNAMQNDRVAYQITVNNSGTQTLNNVYVVDLMPNGLNFANGTLRVDGQTYGNDGSSLSRINLGSMGTAQQHVITFEATVNSGNGSSVRNTATAYADSTSSVQDWADVYVNQQGSVNMVLSKTAINDRLNMDAQLNNAQREDFITYTLTARNNGTLAAQNFIVSDDLSGVLNYADIVRQPNDNYVLNGSVISWPAETVQPGNAAVHTFRVRVKNSLPSNGTFQMVNTYGNTVTVKISNPQVLGAVFVAPRTGASATAGLIFAGMVTAAFAILKRKNLIPSIKIQ